MRPITIWVIVLNIAFLGASYGIYLAGQAYAPELIASQAMAAPLVLSLLGFGGWLLYWSVTALKLPEASGQDDKT